jgi:hypothetical protein
VNRRATENKRSGMRSIRPTQLKSNIMLSHTYRFVSTSGSATAVTTTSLGGCAGTMCTVANSNVQILFDSFRVNRVEVYSPPSSQGSAVTCSLNWEGTEGFAPNMEVSDTTVSVTAPAYINCVPPPRSVAGFWNRTASSTTIFTLVAPAGSIIDVSLSLILSDGMTPTGISITTGTLGILYYLSLDANSTHVYTPVSLTTTT